MSLSSSKLAIIGIGNVGTALAHQLVITNPVDAMTYLVVNMVIHK